MTAPTPGDIKGLLPPSLDDMANMGFRNRFARPGGLD